MLATQILKRQHLFEAKHKLIILLLRLSSYHLHFFKLECLREVVVNYIRKELTQLEHLGGKTGAILYY